MNENTFQIFPCDYKVPCHTHQCHGRAAYYVGRPVQKHTGTLMILCEKCANELIDSAVTLHEIVSELEIAANEDLQKFVPAIEVNADPAPEEFINEIAKASSEMKEKVSIINEELKPLPFTDVLELDGKPIEEYTVKELQKALVEISDAENLGITGISRMTKKELIAEFEKLGV